ncbi:hypothetical protein, conserved [Entamoeba dispar SAW760]|uniref:Phosphatase 2A Regulatory Subunit A helical domain-containing protein n=1 Tax=Entamoeba dispar (strain ATCC PRA-260 / SAW760) TaxID=370354 RepID=B0EHB8_ENTDS|nr:uncharacterized protein EDI_023950 [Entamoeba dispar SAW760]EDR26111.1 hypothetical protein, conserved [Entamoeba dispar SAW760]|eukprot:EDR26111.1 hypothetical protein, conserved [Entamoeba dispar SAW760]
MADSLYYSDRLKAVESLENPSLEQLFPFLGDQDPSVIVTALNKLPKQQTPLLVEPLNELANNVNPSIRCVVATLVSSTLPHKEAIDLINKLLKDDSSDVKITSLTAAQTLLESCKLESYFDLVSSIISLTNDPEWRVRSFVQLLLPEIVSFIGADLAQKVIPVIKNGLKDSCLEVRRQAVLSMADMVKMFGSDWGRTYIIPIISLYYTHPNYKIRQSTIAAMVEVGCVMGKDSFSTAFLPMILNLAFDSTSNVRLTILQQLGVLIQRNILDQGTVNSRIAPCVETLLKDKDSDVVMMANNLKPLLHPE